MTRLLLFFVLIVFSGLLVHADENKSEAKPLDFWGINMSNFHADTPKAITIVGSKGNLGYYWYWTFKFNVKTNLEELKNYFKEMKRRLEENDANDDAELLGDNMARIDATLKQIKKTKLYVYMLTDADQLLPDISSNVVRNMVEKKSRKKLYTTKEIMELDLQKIPETTDQDLGRGKWVQGIAVFSGISPKARELEIRVSGLGNRRMPAIVPGQLITPEFLEIETTYEPALKKVMCFDYRKIGDSGEAHLDPIKFEGKRSEWTWLWPLQIYTGKYRQVEVERASGITRKYLYCPYYIWNNTGKTRNMNILQAGFKENITWGGEKLAVHIYDDGKPAQRWKSQVMKQILERNKNGEEKSFIEENESFPIELENIDIAGYYRDNLNLEYIPEDSDVVQDPEALKEQLANDDDFKKKAAELKKLKEEDHKRKLNFLPESMETRLFKGDIPAGKIVAGVYIVRWAVTDLEVLIDELVSRLYSKSILGMPENEKLPLYNEYIKLRTETRKNANSEAEPEKAKVIQMLAKIAKNTLQEKGIEVSEYDLKQYGGIAPIGVLVNKLAWDKLQSRADDKGITDSYFKVNVDGAPDRASVMSQFRRILPAERGEVTIFEDKFKDLGTREGISRVKGTKKVDTSTTDEDEDKNSEESVW